MLVFRVCELPWILRHFYTFFFLFLGLPLNYADILVFIIRLFRLNTADVSVLKFMKSYYDIYEMKYDTLMILINQIERRRTLREKIS